MDLIVAGTIFVSPIVRLLIAKVSTYCSVDLALVWSVNGELKRLAQTLKLIEVVLDDAEKRQVENNLLVNWLGELKDVAYDAEDILAELQYKLLRNKMKKRTYGFGFKIAYKIRSVNTKLDGITNNMKRFNFINQLGSSGTNGNIPETSSNINDPAAVVGRMDDISKILDLLNQEIFSVVRITGMGGIGKTTLAQLVYAIADHFQIKMWVSVSRKSNIEEIFRDLLGPNFDRHSSLEDIVDRLKERLMVGKCLIVLDDVWMNRDINVQELLKDLLSMSCKGSKILMTTRSTVAIPPMTDCRYMIYQLQGLPKYDCWSIIKKIAFGHDGARETTDLVNIGKQIASKCGGLPLVAKTLGGLLYSKKDKGEWLSILNSQIWNLPTEQNKINSLLKLSYDHLSPHVKRCFSQCSIYPKGHYFLKKELILLWMAEGLLSHSNASPETLGNEYFKILLLNSFFLDEQRNKWGDIKFCRMHDLVHDLAISIAGNDSRMVNVSSENFIKDNDANVIQQPKFRRLGLQFLDYDACAIPSEIYTASKKLHTLVSFGRVFNRFYYAEGVWAKQISSLSLLRVLNLSHAGIEELPQSICKLKHLRYLDLSRTGIRTFPCSFCQLYSLQTLRLKGCNIKELPQDMGQLISLEHLIFSYKYRYRGSKNSLISARIELSQMPRDVSSLGKLKTLSLFIVGIGKGYGIEELKDLNLLGGKLIIENLGSVTDATQANLKGEKDIIHLQLRWDSQSRLYDDEVAADDDDDDGSSSDKWPPTSPKSKRVKGYLISLVQSSLHG
ncbi:putative disease resistance protein RGA3 [Papaver somniferum]|uniref:putative disease resistance protein RGA3 n=1 Tax=Papaver somniferum TaxID=3469 RepID=UPI000E6F825F|nr:putative disease resistance protein RGA3 [Papaver somniferum]XP_026379678.1 putative disease resistance protein RGA3 [Papaver somniferum]